MKNVYYIILMVLLPLPFAMGNKPDANIITTPAQSEANQDSEKEQETGIDIIVKSNNNFSCDLYHKIRGKEGNLFLSPYSVYSALGMVLAGCQTEARVSIQKVMCLPDSKENFYTKWRNLIHLIHKKKRSDTTLATANAFWGQKGYDFDKAFLTILKKYFLAELRYINFYLNPSRARISINKWIEEKTNNKIKEMIREGAISRMTKLILTNAVYFKGMWKIEFNSKLTGDAPFKVSKNKKVNVPMMCCSDEFLYASNETLQVIELPYAQEQVSMLIFLPRKVDGLKDIEEKLTPEFIKTWKDKLKKEKANVLLPRFIITSDFGLTSVLREMGLTGSLSVQGLMIDWIIHKAFVEVNEKGTEAAAATAIGFFAVEGGGLPSLTFRADHPFLFIILDNETGTILFTGRLSNPVTKLILKQDIESPTEEDKAEHVPNKILEEIPEKKYFGNNIYKIVIKVILVGMLITLLGLLLKIKFHKS